MSRAPQSNPTLGHLARRIVLAAGAALLAPAVAAAAEPVSIGPLGGSCSSVVVHPSDPDQVLVIQYLQGLFRSTDGGASFAPQPSGFSSGVRDLTPDPKVPGKLYALDGTKIFESLDFGVTWSPLGLTASETLKSIAVPTTGDDLLAVDAFNVYHSDDGGANWTLADTTVPFGGTVFDVATYAPSDSSVAYYAYNDGIRRSDDGGQSFSSPGSFSEWVQAITVSPTDPDTVFVGTPFNGLGRSTDGGANFNNVGVGVVDGNAEFFAWEPSGRLWYATLNSISTSANGGDTWSLVMGGLPASTPIPLDMAFDSTGRRYLGAEGGGLGDSAGGGLYRMDSGAPTAWDHLGFLQSSINAVAIPEPGGDRVVGIGGGVYKGALGEQIQPTAWHADIGTDTRDIAVDPSDSSRWVTGGVGAFFDNAQIAVLTNGGDTFAKTYEQLGAGTVQDIEFDPFDSNRLIAGIFPGSFGNEAIIRSVNGGASWIEVPGTAGWATRAIAYDPVNPSRVLQLSDNNQWSGSLNSGNDWLPLQPAWPGTGPAVLLEFDLFESGVLYRGETGGGLWRRDSDGSPWVQLGVGLHSNSDLLQHPQFPGLLWVSDDAGQLLVSTDRGDTFSVAETAPAGSNYAGLAIDTSDGSIVAGTDGSSAWELPQLSPFVALAEGSNGTDDFVPGHLPAGGLPQVGNADFALTGHDIVGGATVFLMIGISELNAPIFGGTLVPNLPWVATVLTAADGTSGIGGDGTFSTPIPIPDDEVLVGLSLVSQFLALDPGSGDVSGLVLSDALRSTLQP